jgi:hypothetical protein
MTVTPSSVSFGSVPLGTSSSQTIRIKNISSARIQLARFSALGSGFSLTDVPSDLLMAANTYLTFNVVFSPSSAGAYSGSLPLIANGVTVGSIPLSGTGIAASTF